MAATLDVSVRLEFDTSSVGQRWTRWKRLFDYYVMARGLTDAQQKKALLLHLAGPAVRYRDTEEKRKGKNDTDVKRRATISNVKTGDKVLLQQNNKLSLPYYPELFTVADRRGHEVTATSDEDGRSICEVCLVHRIQACKIQFGP